MTEYRLSHRTRTKLEELRQIQSDMAEMQTLANVLMAVAPFRGILDGFGFTDPIEILTSEFDLVGSASSGLSSHFRAQLKFFCQSEGVSSQNSEGERRFWQRLSQEF